MTNEPKDVFAHKRITFTAEQIKKLAEIHVSNRSLSSRFIVAVRENIFDWAVDIHGYEVLLRFLESFQKVKNQSVHGIMDEFWGQFSGRDKQPFPV